MSIDTLPSSNDTNHTETLPNSETEKKLQGFISRVIALLEGNTELQDTFKEEFKSVFDSVTKDPQKLDKLLNAIEGKMIAELAALHERFKNDPELKSEDAKKQATEIIKKYSAMGLHALENSIS